MQRFELLRSGAVDWLRPERPKTVRLGGLLGFERLRYRQTAIDGSVLVTASESTHLFTREKTGLISVADLSSGDRAMVKWNQDDFFVKSPLIRSPDKEVALRFLTGPQEEMVHTFVAVALAQAMSQTA